MKAICLRVSVYFMVLFSMGVTAVNFNISPTTFVPGVTSFVTMRCEVGSSGDDMMQLLVMQLQVMDRGSLVPVVTYTPGRSPVIMELGQINRVTVEGNENQFSNIGQSYMTVTYPFPEVGAAGNYTCLVSGLSNIGTLVRYTQEATLSVGAAVDELPRFMTQEAVDLREMIERIKNQKDTLLQEAAVLRAEEQNVTAELSRVEKAYIALASEVDEVRARASQLTTYLSQPLADLEHLKSVRPGMKVAFHAAMSALGARTAQLRTPLVFDHVIVNQGQGYNATSGVFRAPITGTYVLTASVEAGGANRNSELSIMMGDTILQTMHMSDDIDYQHSTTTTIAQVPAGAEVTCEFTWLQNLPGYVGSTQPAAPYVTAFTGYILW